MDSSTDGMRGDFFTMELSVVLPPAQQGGSPSLFPVSKHKEKINLVGKNKQKKNQQEKRTLCRFGDFF